jgi:hypothetical protein
MKGVTLLRSRFVMLTATVAAAVGLSLTMPAAAAPAGGGRWTVTQPQNPSPQANYLSSMVAFGRHDVWAVGAWYRPDLSTPGTLTEHWNGSSWKTVQSPNVTEGYNELYGVDGVASNDIWAVGYDNIANYGSERTLALHWNGRTWKVVTTPNLGTHANFLQGVTAISSKDAWAVGFGDDPGGFAGHAMALHWNGSAWHLRDLTPPQTQGSDLAAVDAVASNDVWAVGSQDGMTLTEHFDGKSWSSVPSPNGAGGSGSLYAVAAIAPDDVWASGSAGNGGPNRGGPNRGGPAVDEATLLMHWDGSKWSVVPSPDGPNTSNELTSLKAFGPDNVWAAGSSYDDLQVTSRTLVERWDGSAWRLVKSPNPDPEYDWLMGIGGADAKQVWAVGGTSSLALAMHR